MNCPTCNSDNTQRLEVIYQAGTQSVAVTSTTTAVSSGGGAAPATASTASYGTSSSYLAIKCGPPRRKTSTNAISIGATGASVYLFSKTPLWSLLAAISVVIAIVLYLRNRKYNAATWPPLYEVWKRSWHCNKCGHIYAPAQ